MDWTRRRSSLKIDIKPFTPDLTDSVGHLIITIQRDEFGLPLSLEDQPDLADIPGVYQKNNGNFWVALAGADKVVGTVALADIGGGHGALMKMFVAGVYRGARLGVGQRLLDTLLGHARRNGFADVLLGTTSVMTRAHAFYGKNGFKQINKDGLAEGFPLMQVDTRFYRLDLTP